MKTMIVVVDVRVDGRVSPVQIADQDPDAALAFARRAEPRCDYRDAVFPLVRAFAAPMMPRAKLLMEEPACETIGAMPGDRELLTEAGHAVLGQPIMRQVWAIPEEGVEEWNRGAEARYRARQDARTTEAIRRSHEPLEARRRVAEAETARLHSAIRAEFSAHDIWLGGERDGGRISVADPSGGRYTRDVRFSRLRRGGWQVGAFLPRREASFAHREGLDAAGVLAAIRELIAALWI